MTAPREKSLWEIVLTAVAWIVGALAGIIIYQYVHAQLMSRQIVEQLTQVSSEQSKSLPKMVDAITRWDSISAGPGKIIRYRYTITSPLSASGSVSIEKLRPKVLESYRTNPGLALFRDNGVTMIYDYFDASDNALGEIQVGPDTPNP